MTTTERITIRKVCNNCNMNAIFTNQTIELTNYGSLITEDHLHCENCGEDE